MNRMQKMAWWMVGSISTGTVVSVIAFALLYIKIGLPRAYAGFAFMAIAGFGGLGPVIFKKDKGKIVFDERGKLIKERAALAAFAASYLFTGLACMIPFFVLGPKATVSVIWLPNIWFGTFLTAFFVQSIAILVQYSVGGKNHE
ncbi:MAG: DUF2178 domain-containing protein [Sedimentisphaerales bacterium]|nr:DUF2178 domain-containing protein [Sedimentisphaerales bacterium]